MNKNRLKISTRPAQMAAGRKPSRVNTSREKTQIPRKSNLDRLTRLDKNCTKLYKIVQNKPKMVKIFRKPK